MNPFAQASTIIKARQVRAFIICNVATFPYKNSLTFWLLTHIIPCLIDFGNNKKEEYIYSGSGQKLYRAIFTDTVTTAYTEYIGMFVLEYTGANSRNLKYILTPAGLDLQSRPCLPRICNPYNF
jgi:hypothetical protein